MTPPLIPCFLPSLAAALTLALGAPLHAKDKTATTPAASSDIELDRLVIQDSPPGSIPFAAAGQYSLFTGSISYPPVIGFVGLKDKKLPMTWLDSRGRQKTGHFTWRVPAPEHIALKNGGQILAIDGIDVAGLDYHILKKLVFEGKAGEPVTLVIRGCGEEMHLFREITVRRISEKKHNRIRDEAASRELRPARSLAELPATPEPAP
jgi:hypothetical protein